MIIIGIVYLVLGSIALGSIMMPFELSSILNDDYLQIIPYDAKRHTNLVSDGIYGYVRHPLQAGVLFIFLFASGVYTIERVIFLGVNLLMVLIGVIMEEKKLCALEKEYPEYMEKVRSRFIPFIF